jgi:hypothetical protein
MKLRQMGRASFVAFAAALMLVISIAPASATGQASVYRNQAEAGRVNYWFNGHVRWVFRVSDTQCDHHTVYAQYQRAGASRRTLPGPAGCHNSADYYRYFTRGQTIKYRVCVKISAWPDTCGRWKWDTTGG